MDYTGIFTYNTGNLLTTPENIITSVICIVTFGIIIFLMRKIFLIIVGLYWQYLDRCFIAGRKKTLSDLVLMKDIQTELEKEIEQATLQAAFQN